MGLWNLKKDEVRKLGAFLRKDGFKLPRVGICVSLGNGGEICRDAHGYYAVVKDYGEFDELIRHWRSSGEK